MFNRHIIKNIMYIICLGMITLITVAIMIDSCKNQAEGDLETILRNNDSFHELEVCTTSYNIIFDGSNVYIALLGLIGMMQIFYAYFIFSNHREKKSLATAGQLLLVLSICSLFILRTSISAGF